MPRVNSDTLKSLQKNPDCIRNICILAHVDHGKTSLSDSLLASNGIISQKLAGKVRYLDSRPDEQSRGITMESSAVSLYFRILHKQEDTDQPLVKEHLINLIDSPGHIDFSGEVNAASKLCDGAIILVDVVEGVCSQTVTVLRQCWTEKLKPILVLNKIDRLILELQLSPQEAYIHLSKIIEQINSVMGSFFMGERLLDDLSWREQLEINTDAEFIERDDDDIYFNPEKNNVVFASAIDGWGFNISQFVKFYESKLNIKREKLQKVLWGNFFIDPKTKKVIGIKGRKDRPLKPLFVNLILENIWKIYSTVCINKDSNVLEKITKTLNIKLLPRDLRSKDSKNLLKVIMGQWLPVSTAVLLTVIERLPSPVKSQEDRVDTILGNSSTRKNVDPCLLSSLRQCNQSGAVCGYVSKMISISNDDLPCVDSNISIQDHKMEYIRNARKRALEAAKLAEDNSKANATDVDYSISLYTRAKDTVFTPDIDIDPKKNDSQISTKFENNFLNTNELVPFCDLNIDDTQKEVIGDPINQDTLDAIPLSSIDDTLDPMFSYENIDPVDVGNQDKEESDEHSDTNECLIAFTRIYSGTLTVGQTISVLGPKYDPQFPDKHIQSTTITGLYLFMGRELISLEQCPAGNIVGIRGLAGNILKNGTLVDVGIQGVNLAGINLNLTPIVRVALEPSNPCQMNKLIYGLNLLTQADPYAQTYIEQTGEHILCTAGELHLERCLKDLKERFACISITSSKPVVPYRETFISKNDLDLSSITDLKMNSLSFIVDNYEIYLSVKSCPEILTKFLVDHEIDIEAILNNEKADHLLDNDQLFTHLKKLFTGMENKDKWISYINNICVFGPKRVGPNILISKNNLLRKFMSPTPGTFNFETSLINGFQLAVSEGPLAKEPVQGMMVIIEDIRKISKVETTCVEDGVCHYDSMDISGKLITTTRNFIYQAFLSLSPRLMWAMYTCDIQASVEVLGKVYTVVQQRRGRIVSEDIKEGTSFFQIVAKIPVVEAFGFSEDIRKKTSGAAQPQLVFSGFEIIDLDPFWVPTTEKELEDLGDTADKENIAKKHMNSIRRRKGLFIDEKVVENAEKQRTLKRN